MNKKIVAALVGATICFAGFAYIIGGTFGLEIFGGIALATGGIFLVSWAITEMLI